MEGTLPLSKETATRATMFIQGVGLAPVSVPLHTVFLCCDLVTGPVVVGTRPSLPTPTIPGLFPACAVTKAAARRAALQPSDTAQSDVASSNQQVSGGVMSSDTGDGENTVCANDDLVSAEATMCSREQLIVAQENDVELRPLMNDAVGEEEM